MSDEHLGIRIEEMNSQFRKYHIEGPWPFSPVLHRFTAPDRGDAHDHPWPFRSIILYGGYVEETFDILGGRTVVERKLGDSFRIEACHIHRIISLPHGECWTMILPEAWERKSGFYQFREDGTYHRFWDGDWTRLGAEGE